MVKKRKGHGRTKGRKGRGSLVQCAGCGALIPRDKAKKIYRKTSFLDPRLISDLKRQGAYIPGSQQIKWYCVSCAVHRGYYAPRAEEKRRKPFKKRR